MNNRNLAPSRVRDHSGDDPTLRLVGRVPQRVTDAIQAANAHDVAALVRCFTDTGTVDAWGVLFQGASDIEVWAQQWVVAHNVRFTDLLSALDGSDVAVHSQVHGQGYNGPATLSFTAVGDAIDMLRLTR